MRITRIGCGAVTDFGGARGGRSALLGGGRGAGGTMSSSEDDGEGSLTTWMLGAIKERNLALEGYCQTEGCGHFYMFKVDNLISGMGADYVVPEILPGVVCKECGGNLKVKLAMGSPGG